MRRIIMFLFIGYVNVLSSLMAQVPSISFTQAELEEFELLNLCHCHEYLTLRNYDYIKWKSEEAKKKNLKEIENVVFTQYPIRRNLQYGHYYQAKIDSTLFLKRGISIYFGGNLNFSRLDSLYYEPIVQCYVKEQSKTENLPYLGCGDQNFFVDCFYQIKAIPLKEELEYFIEENKNNEK